jgi:hypothetical protein
MGAKVPSIYGASGDSGLPLAICKAVVPEAPGPPAGLCQRNSIALNLSGRADRHTAFEAFASYYEAGAFLRERSPPGKNLFYFPQNELSIFPHCAHSSDLAFHSYRSPKRVIARLAIFFVKEAFPQQRSA